MQNLLHLFRPKLAQLLLLVARGWRVRECAAVSARSKGCMVLLLQLRHRRGKKAT